MRTGRVGQPLTTRRAAPLYQETGPGLIFLLLASRRLGRSRPEGLGAAAAGTGGALTVKDLPREFPGWHVWLGAATFGMRRGCALITR